MPLGMAQVTVTPTFLYFPICKVPPHPSLLISTLPTPKLSTLCIAFCHHKARFIWSEQNVLTLTIWLQNSHFPPGACCELRRTHSTDENHPPPSFGTSRWPSTWVYRHQRSHQKLQLLFPPAAAAPLPALGEDEPLLRGSRQPTGPKLQLLNQGWRSAWRSPRANK